MAVHFDDDAIRRIAAAVKAFEQRGQPAFTPRNHPQQLQRVSFETFLALTTTAGPGGEEDYADDSRYWVKRAAIGNTDQDGTSGVLLQPRDDTELVLPSITTATNIGETTSGVFGEEFAGTHLLPENTPVQVFADYDRSQVTEGPGVEPSRVKKWWFNKQLSGAFFVAVVTACTRTAGDAVGNRLLTVKKLTGLPYSYLSGGEIQVWAGIDPMIVIGSMVLVVPIEPIDDEEEGTISFFALPHLSVNPLTLDEPDAACITTFGDRCDEVVPSDPCI